MQRLFCHRCIAGAARATANCMHAMAAGNPAWHGSANPPEGVNGARNFLRLNHALQHR